MPTGWVIPVLSLMLWKHKVRAAPLDWKAAHSVPDVPVVKDKIINSLCLRVCIQISLPPVRVWTIVRSRGSLKKWSSTFTTPPFSPPHPSGCSGRWVSFSPLMHCCRLCFLKLHIATWITGTAGHQRSKVSLVIRPRSICQATQPS